MMKRIVVSGMLLLACMGVRAEELTVEEFTISAGETKDIAICLSNSQSWGGFQFDIFMPEGVTIFEDEDGLYYEATDRLRYKSGRNTCEMEVRSRQISDGSYRFVVANGAKANISGNEGAVMTLRIVASDAVSTGTCQPTMKGIVLSDVSGNASYLDDKTYTCHLQLSVGVSSLGYATFSWPKALDFTGQAVEAFIATEQTEGVLHLEPVTKVAAGTGLVLKGNEGTYHPQTIDDADVADASPSGSANLLTGTAYGSWTVTGGDVFVLSNLTNGRAGFYRAAEGVDIPQYKAYLRSASAARELLFDEGSTGIGAVAETAAGKGFYNLSGQRTATPVRQGVYISGGKKAVVSGSSRQNH